MMVMMMMMIPIIMRNVVFGEIVFLNINSIFHPIGVGVDFHQRGQSSRIWLHTLVLVLVLVLVLLLVLVLVLPAFFMSLNTFSALFMLLDNNDDNNDNDNNNNNNDDDDDDDDEIPLDSTGLFLCIVRLRSPSKFYHLPLGVDILRRNI